MNWILYAVMVILSQKEMEQEKVEEKKSMV